MEYSINKLACLAGISTRTLRYYDQIGLLSPARIASNGYRIYGQNEVDVLQQILFYRGLGVPLEEIRRILLSPEYDRGQALETHLSSLLLKKNQLELLIANVRKTISSLKGEIKMSDEEKFEGLRDTMIHENESRYGTEIRTRFGNDAMDASQRKLKAMNEEQWEAAQKLSAQINLKLKQACEQGQPESGLSQEVCELHKRWLCLFWKDGSYTKEKHLALAQMYCEDERFQTYYEAIAPGGARFLPASLEAYCKNNGVTCDSSAAT